MRQRKVKEVLSEYFNFLIKNQTVSNIYARFETTEGGAAALLLHAAASSVCTGTSGKGRALHPNH